MTRAVEHVHEEIARTITGMDARDQILVDRTLIELDGTLEKSRLGANALLGVSMAVAKAAAELAGLPLYSYLGGPVASLLPVPLMNVLNGGAHANNSVDVQEFMLVPMGFDTYSEALRAGTEIYHVLRKQLDDRGLSTAVGDEGGFAPNLPRNEAALELLVEAIEVAGYRPGDQVALALDVAASELVGGSNGGGTEYVLEGEGRSGSERRRPGDDLPSSGSTATPWCRSKTASPENDHEGWKLMTDALGDRIQIVGDDLFVTNPRILSGRDRRRPRQRPARQGEPDWHSVRDPPKAVEMAKTHAYSQRDQPPVGGDRGHDDRRSRRRHPGRPDQDRRALPQRPSGEVQSASKRIEEELEDAADLSRKRAPSRAGTGE